MLDGPRDASTSQTQFDPLGSGTIRRIAWTEVFPWLLIFRCFGLSLSPTIILLATVGIILTPIGWIAAEFCFVGEDMAKLTPDLTAATRDNDKMADRAAPFSSDLQSVESVLPWNSNGVLRDVHGDFVQPYVSILSYERAPRKNDTDILATKAFGLRRFAYYGAGAVWMLLIWVFIGGAISRIAVVRLARDERVGLIEAIRFTAKRYLSFLSAPMGTPVCVLLFIALMILPGLVMRIELGAFVVSLFWFFFLIFGFLLGLLLLIFSVSWPMTVSSISAESCDAFDAFSKANGYVLNRPLHYLFFVSIAILLLGLGGMLAGFAGEATIHVTRWGASWGAGADRMHELRPVADDDENEDEDEDEDEDDDRSKMNKATSHALNFWDDTVRTIRTGFVYGMFWCLASAIFLVMRRCVDETEFTDVSYDGTDQFEDLPQLEPPPALDGATSPPPPLTDGPTPPSDNASSPNGENDGGDNNQGDDVDR